MGYLKLGRLVFKPSERVLMLVLLLCFQVNVVFLSFFFGLQGSIIVFSPPTFPEIHHDNTLAEGRSVELSVSYVSQYHRR